MSVKTKIKKLDAIFSKYIRLRDSDNQGICKCCTCGEYHDWKRLDNGHFIKRQHMGLRYSEVNCHAQCRKCNWLGQGEDAKYERFIIKKYGQHTLNQILYQKTKTVQFTEFELDEMIKIYTNEVKNLLNEKAC